MNAPDGFTVVVDTNVLFGSLTRNLVLYLAERERFRPVWSVQTIAELGKHLSLRVGVAKMESMLNRLAAYFPDAEVHCDDALVRALKLPDPDDRHVLAAAIQTKAQVIVTENIADFPEDVLGPYGIKALRLDPFLADCFDLDPDECILAYRQMLDDYSQSKLDVTALIGKVEALHLPLTVAFLKEHADKM